jgi:hypothetical protein
MNTSLITLRRLALISALAATGLAQAGVCPADKVAANALAGAPTMPAGVVDTELASIDLAKENVKLDQRRLRFRHMTIAPGGIVPLHSHEDRPALIMVNAGEIYENSSKCAVPILHKAGDISRERYARLAHEVKRILSHAIARGGTTLRDFISPDGEPGYFELELAAYGRTGEPCKVCGAPIRAVTLGQRSTFYCARCQR